MLVSEGYVLFDCMIVKSLKGRTVAMESITLCTGCGVEGRRDYRGTQEGTFGRGDGTVSHILIAVMTVRIYTSVNLYASVYPPKGQFCPIIEKN